MIKKYITREVKIGLLVIVSGAILFFVFNFLKGINIFNPTNYYYTTYADLDGLMETNPVFIKGHKVGQVSKILYDFSKPKPFVVVLDISNDIQLTKGTTSELVDNGLLGGKAINLNYAPYSGVFQEKGDTLLSITTEDMVTQISNSLIPKIDHLLSTTDSLITSVRRIADSKELKASINAIAKASANMQQSSVVLKKAINEDVPAIVENARKVSDDFVTVGNNVRDINFQKTVSNIDSTMYELHTLAASINSNKGSLGLLMNDRSLYDNLSNVSKNADQLMLDLKQNPKRYVHFSIFGKKEKK